MWFGERVWEWGGEMEKEENVYIIECRLYVFVGLLEFYSNFKIGLCLFYK